MYNRCKLCMLYDNNNMYYYISWYTKGEVGHLCAAASGRWILLKQSCAICKWIGVKYLLPAFFILCCCGYLHRRHTGCELGFPSGPTHATTIYLYIINIYSSTFVLLFAHSFESRVSVYV